MEVPSPDDPDAFTTSPKEREREALDLRRSRNPWILLLDITIIDDVYTYVYMYIHIYIYMYMCMYQFDSIGI